MRRRPQLESLEERALLAITVDSLADNTVADDGLTTLREAIAAANSTAVPETITFAPSLTAAGPATIELSQGQLTISNPLSITGLGATQLTIEAQGSASQARRVFSVNTGISVTISGLTLTGGYVGANADGGAIYNQGNLTLNSMVIAGNFSGRNGGAIFTSGSNATLTVKDSTLEGNSASFGGALYVKTDALNGLTIDRSAVLNNRATNYGGLVLTGVGGGGTAIIVNSTLSDNEADNSAGAIQIGNYTPTLTIVHSTITNNRAGVAGSGGGGGIRISGSPTPASPIVHNTILAGNTATTSNTKDISGTLNATSSYNLIGAGGPILAGPGNYRLQSGESVGLSPLGDYGGPTKTHALLPDSSAVDQGNDAQALGVGGAALTTDGRGFARATDYPGVSNGAAGTVDKGAYELATPLRGDFNGDGRQEEFAYEISTRSLVNAAWENDAGPELGTWGELPSVPGLWQNFRVGDFNGDGRDDVAARNSLSNQMVFALSEGIRFRIATPSSSPSQWDETYVGDFDGDGSDELLGWKSTGWEVLHYDDQTGFRLDTSTNNWGTALRGSGITTPITVGDVNRDGRDDLIARESYATNAGWQVAMSRESPTTGANQFAAFNAGTWFDTTNSISVAPGEEAVRADAPYQQLLEIYSEIYNNFELEFYPGFMKGLPATAETKAGNPWEQSALLVDRLEAAGFDADLVQGSVLLPVQQLFNWIGIENDGAYSRYNLFLTIRKAFDNNALPIDAEGFDVRTGATSEENVALLAANTEYINFRHPWVRVLVPTENGMEPVDVDPSFKFKDIQPGKMIDLASSGQNYVPPTFDIAGRESRGSFDELGFFVDAGANQLPLEWYEDRLMDYLVASGENLSLADIPRDGPILQQQFESITQLPRVNAPPAEILGVYDNFGAILADDDLTNQLTHRFKVSASVGSTFDSPFLSFDAQDLLPYEGIGSSNGQNISLSSSTVASYGLVEGEAQQIVIDSVNSYEPYDFPLATDLVGDVHDLRTEASFPLLYPSSPVTPIPPHPGFQYFVDNDYANVTSPSSGELEFEKASAIAIDPNPDYEFTANTWLDFEVFQEDNPNVAQSYDPTFVVGVTRYTTGNDPLPYDYDYYLIDGTGFTEYDDTYRATGVQPGMSAPIKVSILVGAFHFDDAENLRIHILHSDNYIRTQRESGNDDPLQGAGTTTISNIGLREHVPSDYDIDGNNNLLLTGESHKTKDINYRVTQNTVVKFDFLSTNEGEFHYIGFDVDDTYENSGSNEVSVAFYGENLPQQYKAYTQPGQTQEITLQIGQFMAGSDFDANKIVFGTFDEFGTDATSRFGNVQIYDLEESQFNTGGDALDLYDTSYVAVDADYTITPDTILEFDFQGYGTNQTNYVGWDTDNVPGDGSGGASASNVFSFYSPSNHTFYDGSGTDTIRIPIGLYLSGTSSQSISNLVFGVDDDGGNTGLNSNFSNVRLSESSSEIVGSGGNQRIRLTGNVFERLPVDYDITPRTYLEFDFQILEEGRFHAIGWDADDDFDANNTTHNRFFSIGGTDDSDYDNYSSVISWQNYNADGQQHRVRINMGDFLTGIRGIDNLVFLNDGGIVEYSDFEIGEDNVSSSVFWNEEFVTANPQAGYTTDAIQIGYDVSTINSLPAYRPYLEVNGSRVQSSSVSEFLYAGETAIMTTEHFAPDAFSTDEPTFSYQYESDAGQVHAIALDANQYSRESLARMESSLIEQQNDLLDSGSISYGEAVDAIADLLTYTGSKYWDKMNSSARLVGGYFHSIGVKTGVGSGLITADPAFISNQEVAYLNLPSVPENLGLDVPNTTFAFYDNTGTIQAYSLESFQLLGFDGSALENAIVEEVINTSSISTMRGLERAYKGDLGLKAGKKLTDNDPLVDYEAIQVFESVPLGPGNTNRVIYYRGEIGTSDQIDQIGTPYAPDNMFVRTYSDLLHPTNGELRHHVRPGSTASASIAAKIAHLLEDQSGVAEGVIRVFVPRSRSTVENWSGSVYFAEYETVYGFTAAYVIASDTGPVTNGSRGTNVFRPENFKLPNTSHLYQFVTGDPVTPANGNMIRDELDFTFANPVIPLDFARHYDSQNKLDVGFGVGWVHSFTGIVYQEPDPANSNDMDFVWLRGSGERHIFEDNDFDRPNTLFGQVVTTGAGASERLTEYRDKDGTKYIFESSSSPLFTDPHTGKDIYARLISVQSPTGDHGIDITYESASSVRVTKVESRSVPGRYLQIIYTGGNTIQIRPHEGHQLQSNWIYVLGTGYGESGFSGSTSKRLIQVRHADNNSILTNYTYYTDGPDARMGLMRQITEPNGESHTYEYYANGRVFRVTDSEGNQQSFSYNLFRNLAEFTDERGNIETYLHNEKGQLLRQVHDDRSRLEFTWGGSNEEYLMQTSTDELGNQEVFDYYTADQFNAGELYQHTAKDDVVTRYEYWDPSGTDFDYISGVSKITVDPSDANIQTTYTRDQFGNVLQIEDAEGNLTQYDYFDYSNPQLHLRGLRESETRSKGVSSPEAVGWEVLEEAFTIQPGQDTISVRVAVNSSQTVIADAVRIDRVDEEGVFTRIVDDDRTGSDPDFRLTTTNGTSESTASDPEYSNDATRIDGATATNSATWIFRDLLPGTYRISASWPMGSSAVLYQLFSGLPHSSYDDYATKTQTTASDDFHSHETLFEYDTAGNVTRTITEGLPSGYRVYDINGNVIYEEDATGVATVYTYDALGRLTKSYITEPTRLNFNDRPPQAYTGTPAQDLSGGASVQDSGNTVQLTGNSWKGVALGYDVTTSTILEFDFEAPAEGEIHGLWFAHNLNESITGFTPFYLGGTQAPSTDYITDYQYEPGSGKVHFRIPIGTHIAPGHYENLFFINDNDGPAAQGISKFSKVVLYEPSDIDKISYTYDASGRLTSTTDAVNRKTVFAYDGSGRLVKTTFADGTFTTHDYDEVGNCIAITDELGRTTRYIYDSRNRLIQTTYADGSSTRTRYDGVGNVVETINELGHDTDFTYDEVGRLLTQAHQVKYPGSSSVPVTTTNNYDSLGRLVSTIDANDEKTTYIYDKLNRVIETRVLKDANSSLPPVFLSTTDYDANGNVSRTVVYDVVLLTLPISQGGQGISISSSHDDVLDLIDTHPDFVQVVETAYDAFGRPVESTNADGTTTSTIYDAAGRVRFTFDELRRRTEHEYDQYGRLAKTTSPDPDGFGPSESHYFQYGYNNAGQLTIEWEYVGPNNQGTSVPGHENDTANWFAYDARGRMRLRSDKYDATKTYFVYDTAGQPVATVDPLGNANYTQYDQRGRVIAEHATDPDGEGPQFAPVTRYKYDAAGNVIETIDPLSNSTYFAYDSLGRVRKETRNHTLIADDAEGGDSTFSATDGAQFVPITQSQFYGRDVTYWDTSAAMPRQATWTFDALEQGSYRFAMNWWASAEYDLNAKIEIFRNGQLVSGYTRNGQTVGAFTTVDQRQAPNDIASVHGEFAISWGIVADAISVDAGDKLEVRLSASASTAYLLADAVRLDRVVTREYIYDKNGNLKNEFDELGRVTVYNYDELGRQTAVQLPDPDAGMSSGGGPNGGNLGATVTWSTYDGYGNVIQTQNNRGTSGNGDDVFNVFAYDKRNRLIEKIVNFGDASPDLRLQTLYKYDAVGNLIEETNPLYIATRYRYDRAGNLIDQYDDFGQRRTAAQAVTFSQPFFAPSPEAFPSVATVSPDGTSAMFVGDAWVYIPIPTFQADHRTIIEFDLQVKNVPDDLMFSFDSNTTYEPEEDARYFDLGGRRFAGSTVDSNFRVERFPNGAVRIHLPIGQYLAAANGTGLPINYLILFADTLASNLEFADHSQVTISNVRLYQSDEVRTVRTYDTRGNLVTVREASDPRNITTRYGYDRLSRHTATVLDNDGPLRRIHFTTYNNVGNVIKERNETAGTDTLYEYDRLGRLIKTTLPDPDGNANTPNGLITTFTYDVVGNLIRTTNGEGESTYIDYNEVGLAVTETDGNGDQTHYRYDPVGNLLAVTDAEENTTRYTYDNLDRLRTDTNAFGTRTYLYNNAGNLDRYFDRNGRHIQNVYDTLDRLKTEYWRPTAFVYGGAPTHRFDWTYDKLGRVTKQVDGGSNYGSTSDDIINTFVYDTLGRLIQQTNYDPANLTLGSATGIPRVRQTIEDRFEVLYSYPQGVPSGFAKEVVQRQHQRDAQGNEVELATTYSTYDRLNRHVGVSESDSIVDAFTPAIADKSFVFGYDALGNMTRVYRNHVGLQTDFTYDRADRLTSITHDLVTDIVHSYTYDNASRIKDFDTATNGFTTAHNYSYDEAGQLTGDADANGYSSFYSYDENGNRVYFHNGNVGPFPPITIGPGNRLAHTTTDYYQYDAEGNLTRRTYISTGEVTLYTWDHRNRLQKVEMATLPPAIDFTGGSIASYTTNQDGQEGIASQFAVEDSGRTLHLAGNTWKRISLSSLGLGSSLTVTADTVLSFDFYSPQAAEISGIGLDSDNTYNNPTRFFQLAGSQTGVGLSPDENYAGGWQRYEIRLADFAEAYAVGATLNRLTLIHDDDEDLGGESFFRNIRLTEGPPAATVTESVSYLYDAAGQLVKRTHDANGAATGGVSSEAYVYDGSQLAIVFDTNQKLSHRYLYGPADQVLVDEVFETIGSQQVSDEVLWLLADHQGTVRDIVDSAGTLRKHLGYDPFGAVTGEAYRDSQGIFVAADHAEAVDQAFYYTGQLRDDATAFQKHGQRWYDPQHGRWLSEDPLGFDAGDPNLYRYVGNSPLNYTDPTGTTQAGNPLDALYGNLAGGYSGGVVSPDKPFNYIDPIGSITTPFGGVSLGTAGVIGAKSYGAPSGADFVSQSAGKQLANLNANLSKPFSTSTYDFSGPTRLSSGDIQTQVHIAYFKDPNFHTISRAADERAASQRAYDLIQHGTPTQAFSGQLGLGLNSLAENANPLSGQLNALNTITDPNASTTQKVLAGGLGLLDTFLQGKASTLAGPARTTARPNAYGVIDDVVATIERNADIAVQTARRAALEGTVRNTPQAIGSRAARVLRDLNEQFDVTLRQSSSPFRVAAEEFRDVAGRIVARHSAGSIGADTVIKNTSGAVLKVLDLKTYGTIQRAIGAARQTEFLNRFGQFAEEIFRAR